MAFLSFSFLLSALQFFAAIPGPHRKTPARRACAHITSHLGFHIVKSSGAEYQSAIHGAWDEQNNLFHPTCIVFPREASHVQTAMREIYRAKARYAVQAGGHSAMKGWNTVDDGVLILFSHMHDASYDAAKHSITLEPGIRWGNVTAQLAPYGVAPVGSRVGAVGAGLLLGGGESFLSPSQGFAADNFIALDVVLVNGTLVTATATNEYSDLFRALKGGANRFGIVTRYEVRAVHVGTAEETPFFGGPIFYDASAGPALMKATAKFVREANDPKAALFTTISTSIVNGTAQTTCIAYLLYRGPSLPTSIYADILAIPGALSTQIGPMSYTQVLPLVEPPDFDVAEHGFVQHFGGTSLVPSEDLFLDALASFQNFTHTFMNPNAGHGSAVLNFTELSFTPIQTSQIAAGHAKGGNALLSDTHKAPFAMILLGQQFNRGVLEIPPSVQRGMDLWQEQVPRSPGLPLFINEADAAQKVFETYGEYEFLKATYKKYDPERFNVEHTQGPVGL
ncbi:hypothetical protein C8F01DRAFT_1331641 [Mycena amicta]|nr:hypothetical protein C8F01DRAFT_1331641 [Mycena amicta]